ncbi:hypothetical protein ACFXTH_019029 [Malus domestica]
MLSVSDPGTYLWLPAIWGKSKRNNLAFVKGRGDGGGHQRIHWVNWDTLGRPKCERGLGFQNFQDFNDALLVKQCWRLFLNPTSLWAQTLRDTRLWVDRWLPSRPLGHPTPRYPTNVTLNTKVPLSRFQPSSNPDPRWSPPTDSFIKINVDASWFQMDGKATLAAVLRDHNGQFVAAHKLSIGALSVVFAEAMALLKGCKLAAELGFWWIVAESDSLEVVSSLKGDISNGSWEVFPILENTLRLGNSFQGCRWSWVPRLDNQSADRLALRTNLEMCGKTWVRRPPSSLVHILNKDGLPCPP